MKWTLPLLVVVALILLLVAPAAAQVGSALWEAPSTALDVSAVFSPVTAVDPALPGGERAATGIVVRDVAAPVGVLAIAALMFAVTRRSAPLGLVAEERWRRWNAALRNRSPDGVSSG